MLCPFCSHPETKVIDSRLVTEGNQIRRRRACQQCDERFTTFETIELSLPLIIKHNGSREAFNEGKLRAGIERALEKRPVSADAIEAMIARIKQALRRQCERELPSQVVGEYVMDELRQVDQVAYVRFASVYRSFQDLAEFQAEIDRLADTPQPCKVASEVTSE